MFAMDEEKARWAGFLVVSTLLGALGQFLFKGAFVFQGVFEILLSAGIGLYFLSTIVYFYVLSRTHLSWAYSFGGLSYIFAVILADLFLKESVPPLRWVGVVLIAVGVLLVGKS